MYVILFGLWSGKMSYCTLDPNISDNKLNLGADLDISVFAKFIQF